MNCYLVEEPGWFILVKVTKAISLKWYTVNVYCLFVENVSLRYKPPNALQHMRIYCTDLRNGKDGRIRVRD